MTDRQKRPANSWLVFAAAAGFMAGMLVMAGLFTMFPAGAWTRTGPPASALNAGVPAATSPVTEVRPSAKETPPAVTAVPQTVAAAPAMSANPVEDLRDRRLDIPVKGARRGDLRDTFNELRGSSRRHEAMDLLAPHHTPVIAVEDGKVARLFNSEAGGITVYQFDPSNTYVYYYAHLDRYADGLKEGDDIDRGEVIGYVGTTGNAPKDTPHLHFAIFKMTDKKQWWQGTPIDPYTVLR
jgi:murein DD-endopeptidase MepM/ murein hydrolase activator NlpD